MTGQTARVHMNGRVYDPGVGRMTSADPAMALSGYGQGLNRYAYVLNNPLEYTDPTGFHCHANNGTTACQQDSGGSAGYQTGNGTGNVGADTGGGGGGGGGGAGSQTGASTGTSTVSLDTPLTPDPGGPIDGWFWFRGSNGTGSYSWMCSMDCGGAPTDWPQFGPSFGGTGGDEKGGGPGGPGDKNGKNPSPGLPPGHLPIPDPKCSALPQVTIKFGLFGDIGVSKLNVSVDAASFNFPIFGGDRMYMSRGGGVGLKNTKLFGIPLGVGQDNISYDGMDTWETSSWSATSGSYNASQSDGLSVQIGAIVGLQVSHLENLVNAVMPCAGG